MKISWPLLDNQIATADIPESVAQFAEIIGLDATAQLCLKLGGTHVYLPINCVHDDSLIRSAITKDQALALGKKLGQGLISFPIASKFLARYFRGQGISNMDIARLIRSDVRTIRRYLKPDNSTDRATAK